MWVLLNSISHLVTKTLLLPSMVIFNILFLLACLNAIYVIHCNVVHYIIYVIHCNAVYYIICVIHCNAVYYIIYVIHCNAVHYIIYVIHRNAVHYIITVSLSVMPESLQIFAASVMLFLNIIVSFQPQSHWTFQP